MTEPARIACYNDLVEAFRARKEALGLSDVELDHRAGLASGHANKVLGPARERGIGAVVLEALLMALAVDLIMVPNPEKLARGGEIARRGDSHARTNHPVSKASVERARPLVLSDLGRLGGLASAQVLTAEQRSAKARKAARRRRKLHMLASRAA